MSIDKVICVGKNYLKHAIELGDAVPTEPLYFLKPASTIQQVGQKKLSIALPQGEVHHEVELVFELGPQGAIRRFTIGLDLTRRDLQNHLKKMGQPWEKAKVFKNSSILGEWQTVPHLDEVLAQEFGIKVNGEVRQKGQGLDMRWRPLELIEEAKKFFPIVEGDLLYTGTPEGVGPLKSGDQVEVFGPGVRYEFSVS